MSIEETIREVLREELRAFKEELLARPTPPAPVVSKVPALLSTVDVAKACGVEAETVCIWIRDGKLAGKKTGRHYLVTPAELERFLSKDKGPPPPIEPTQHMAKVMARINGRKP